MDYSPDLEPRYIEHYSYEYSFLEPARPRCPPLSVLSMAETLTETEEVSSAPSPRPPSMKTESASFAVPAHAVGTQAKVPLDQEECKSPQMATPSDILSRRTRKSLSKLMEADPKRIKPIISSRRGE